MGREAFVVMGRVQFRYDIVCLARTLSLVPPRLSGIQLKRQEARAADLRRDGARAAHHERQGGGRSGARDAGLPRGPPAAAQEPERPAELERRLVARHGARVRQEDHDPARAEPRAQQRGRAAGGEAREPRRRLGAPPERDGGLAAAGHVAALSALVPSRVHPGVQGKLPGPFGRLDCGRTLRAGQRVLRRGRGVLPGVRRQPDRDAGRERNGAAKRDVQGRVAAGVFSHHDMMDGRAGADLQPAGQMLSLRGRSSYTFMLCWRFFVCFFPTENINQDYLLYNATVWYVLIDVRFSMACFYAVKHIS